MLRVNFRGRELVFVGDSLAEGGPLAAEEAYRRGHAPFAHLFPDGRVMRHGAVIGARADVAVTGPAPDAEFEPDDPLAAIANIMTHPSWEGRDA